MAAALTPELMKAMADNPRVGAAVAAMLSPDVLAALVDNPHLGSAVSKLLTPDLLAAMSESPGVVDSLNGVLSKGFLEVGRCKLDPGLRKSAWFSKVQPDEDKIAFNLNLVSELEPLHREDG